tara:strand:+ start:101410 stop:102090 length:681 start_codon:yes stop_codon:yes gene_type:complete
LNYSFKKLGHQGFSLVEIMVALMLVALVFAIIPTESRDEEHERLENAVNQIERAVRFANNESILRNSIVRVVIDLEASPQEMYVEYSTDGGLALPSFEDERDLSLSEREAKAKKVKNLDSQFQKVSEFSEENDKFPEEVQVVGLANSNKEEIIEAGKANIYFYPTGEKDASLVFLSTRDEMATVDIPPFENTTFSDYSIYTDAQLNNLDNAQTEKMKELHSEWIKE